MPARDLTADRLALRTLARQRMCSHHGAVPVDLWTGERVAWLCPGCDAQLPAEFILPGAPLLDEPCKTCRGYYSGHSPSCTGLPASGEQ